MADGGRCSSARERRRGSGRGKAVEWGAGREAGQLGQGAGQGLAEAAGSVPSACRRATVENQARARARWSSKSAAVQAIMAAVVRA